MEIIFLRMQISQPAKSLYTFQFLILCLSQVLFSASFNMIIPELPAYLSSLGGAEYKGLIISLFTLTAGLSRPFSGKLTDTVGRIPIMVFGTAVCVVCSLFYPILSSVAGFLLLRFLHGFSTGFTPTALSAYVADIVPVNRRGEAMGIIGVSMNVGASISPVFGSYLATNYSLDMMFYCSSALAIAPVIILAGMSESLQKRQAFSLKLLYVKRTDIIEPVAITPAVIVLLVYMGYGVLLTITPDQCEYLGMSNKGLFFTSVTVFSILSRLVAGRVSDRIGRVPVIKLSVLLVALSLTLFAWADSPFMILVAAGAYGFSVGVASPAVFAWAIDRCSDQQRGRAMATVFIALEIGIGGGALGSAWIYDNDPTNFGTAFLITAAITSLGIIYLWKVPNRP